MCWFLAKNLVFWDPPLKRFHNRTDLDWSATAIFMSLKEPNCFRKSLHDIASASSFYAWNENENYLQFLFLFFIFICYWEIFLPKTENGKRIPHFHGIFDQKHAFIFTFAMIGNGNIYQTDLRNSLFVKKKPRYMNILVTERNIFI